MAILIHTHTSAALNEIREEALLAEIVTFSWRTEAGLEVLSVHGMGPNGEAQILIWGWDGRIVQGFQAETETTRAAVDRILS